MQTNLNAYNCPKLNPKLITHKNEQNHSESHKRCAGPDLWSYYSPEQQRSFVRKIAQVSRIKPNDRIFEWGTACGDRLMWIHDDFGPIEGLGIDRAQRPILWAQRQNDPNFKFCLTDGRSLDWLPNETFDHSISFGTIHHYLPEEQCNIIKHMIRITKHGGYIWNGFVHNANATIFSSCLSNRQDIDFVQVPHAEYFNVKKYTDADLTLIIRKKILKWY